jgi:hypothetical protein
MYKILPRQIYDFQVVNAGEGNVTEKLRNRGVQGIWCVTATGKCGNHPMTRNWIFTKGSSSWEGTGGEYSPTDRSWEDFGCPFRMD